MEISRIHSLREEEEALPEPAGVGVESPVTPVGWEEGEKSMFRVGGIDVSQPAQEALGKRRARQINTISQCAHKRKVLSTKSILLA